MISASEILAGEVERALRAIVGADNTAPALIKTADPKFGDYQANGVMSVAKRLGQNPRALAEKVIAELNVSEISEPPTVAGAGFINFRIKPEFVVKQISAAAKDERLGVPLVAQPKTVVIDFSSPNVAKPMHVGHIRSTIIGECLARVLRFLGHRVITDNHIGDWGTQFGMLIVGWKQHRNNDALRVDPIAELERLYKLIQEQSKQDEAVAAAARSELAKLQRGDTENRAIWEKIIELSRHEFESMYRRLGVTFDHTLGESFYNPKLQAVTDDLERRQIARVSEGALCIFLEGQETPVIVRKADGAFLYATTDLATVHYRIEQWHPQEIIYVTDARQKLHFQQIFAIAKTWLPDVPELKHVWFGSILGEDGRPLKTREGAPVKLTALLDEAEERALAVVNEKNPELPAAERKQIARVVGIGAVKYADLLQNRATDYVFSWSRMLAMNGNTAPYMQYAYVRVQSIFRKAGSDTNAGARSAGLVLEHASELDLAKHLLRFSDTLQAVAEDDKPNWLTGYLYDLAGRFSVFYDNCPVIQAAEPTRSSRLTLCRLTADVIKRGLNLLGIEVIEQM